LNAPFVSVLYDDAPLCCSLQKCFCLYPLSSLFLFLFVLLLILLLKLILHKVISFFLSRRVLLLLVLNCILCVAIVRCGKTLVIRDNRVRRRYIKTLLFVCLFVIKLISIIYHLFVSTCFLFQ